LQDGGSPLSPMIARKLLNRLQTKPADEKLEAGCGASGVSEI
jgi:hypothetical protein